MLQLLASDSSRRGGGEEELLQQRSEWAKRGVAGGGRGGGAAVGGCWLVLSDLGDVRMPSVHVCWFSRKVGLILISLAGGAWVLGGGRTGAGRRTGALEEHGCWGVWAFPLDHVWPSVSESGPCASLMVPACGSWFSADSSSKLFPF